MTAAAPASTPRTRRRVMGMTRLAPKTRVSARGSSVVPLHENAILPRVSLTLGGERGLTPAIIGKTFFSTRRPVLEAGGQRPTARCALGRKSVWIIVVAALPRRGARHKLRCHHPRKRVIQYPRAARLSREAGGVLDTPLEPVIGLAEGETRWRGMTAKQRPHPEEPRSGGSKDGPRQDHPPFETQATPAPLGEGAGKIRVRQSVGKAWWHSRSADAARVADGGRRRCGDARGAARAARGRRLARRGQKFYRESPRAGDWRYRGQVGHPRPDGGEDRS